MSEYQVSTYDARQAALEAAKAKFFSSGGQIDELPGFEFKPMPPRNEPEPSPVRQKFKDGAKKVPYSDRTCDERKVERIKAMRDIGLNRHQTRNKMQTSVSQFMRLLTTYNIDFPLAKTGKKCARDPQ